MHKLCFAATSNISLIFCPFLLIYQCICDKIMYWPCQFISLALLEMSIHDKEIAESLPLNNNPIKSQTTYCIFVILC